jgi:phosphoglycolate phosphatase
MSDDATPFRLLVFDWDGTLMDSIGTIVACTQATIRELGLGELPETRLRGLIGLGLRETIDILSPGCDEQTYGRILECYRDHWVGTYRDMPLLFQGVETLLRELADEGYLLAVATGKSRRGLEYALDQTRLGSLFHTTRTVDEAFSKPHPKMLLDILDELGVRAGDALMIGDTTYDLEMARNARTHSLGVCTGGHCREELEQYGPLACLDGVVDLASWLAKRAAAVTA